jgi:myo-inositol-1(or 4)-monophosphatase
MNLDAFWEHIFSDDTAMVRKAWAILDAEERRSTYDFLTRVAADTERIEAQRNAAVFAQNAVRSNPDALPEGALAFAKQIAHETALMLKSKYANSAASLKGDGTMVTQADLEADQMLRSAISARFPQHAVLSEEHNKIYSGEEWAWIIDPIDGTTNFAHGFPCWGVLIALLHFGQPVIGVMDFPVVDEHFHAAIGQGAFLNEARITAAKVEQNGGKAVVRGTDLFAICSRSVRTHAPNLEAKLRISGSSGYDLGLLSYGAVIGLQQHRVFAWDIAPGWLIAEEAGAVLAANEGVSVFPLNAILDYGVRHFSIRGASSLELLSQF